MEYIIMLDLFSTQSSDDNLVSQNRDPIFKLKTFCEKIIKCIFLKNNMFHQIYQQLHPYF